MFDQNYIDVLKPADGAKIGLCRLHDHDSFWEWVECSQYNLEQRWEIMRKRSMKGVVLVATPAD